MPSIQSCISFKFSSYFILPQLLIIIVTLDCAIFCLYLKYGASNMSYSGSLVHNKLPAASQNNTDAVYRLLAVIDILVGYEFISSFQFAASNITTLSFSDSLNTWPSNYFFPQCVMTISISQTSISFYFCISFKMQYNLWGFIFDCSPCLKWALTRAESRRPKCFKEIPDYINVLVHTGYPFASWVNPRCWF